MAVVLVIVAVVVVLLVAVRMNRGTDITVPDQLHSIEVTSSAFTDGGAIPIEYGGQGRDISPALHLTGVADEAVAIAIIMDDIDHPLFGVYNHWTIWNIPPMEDIPAEIAHGESVAALDGAVQGAGYGRHRYRGPKPPTGSHRYRYNVFVLETMLKLEATSGKEALLAAMEGHILQYGNIVGWYPQDRKSVV